MNTVNRDSAKWLCKSTLLVLLGLCVLRAHAQMAPVAPAQRSDRGRSPIAISALPSGQVSVLGFRGGLSLVDSATGRQVPIKASLGNSIPVDMTSARVSDQEFIFVTMYWAFSTQSLQGNQGIVVQYSLQGQEVRKWSVIGHVFAGIAADGPRQTIYLGSANSGDISTLNVAEQTSPRVTEHVSGASMIGPLALDMDGQRLFAADLGSGTIYVVDLAHHKSRVLVSGLGEPAALSYEPSQHKLYIADASRHRISQVSVDVAGAKVSDFSTVAQLREPRGVTVGPNHSVWVADFGAGTVLQLSATGQVTATVRP